MILDSSVIVAILKQEPGHGQYIDAIKAESTIRISAASFVELYMVIESMYDAEITRYAERLLRQIGVIIEPVTVDQAYAARQAFIDFGKGRHSAGLNYGDCFSYALAKATGEPLLFKGDDFSKTDVIPAL